MGKSKKPAGRLAKKRPPGTKRGSINSETPVLDAFKTATLSHFHFLSEFGFHEPVLSVHPLEIQLTYRNDTTQIAGKLILQAAGVRGEFAP